MTLDFFPSRTLTLYLAKMFSLRIIAVLVMLVLVLMMLDLLSTSGEILAVEGNTEADLWLYASLRVPLLIQRFLPYSVLLATIITLVTLNQNSEVIAMKAAGLSAHQVLAPLVLTAMAVAGASFAFNERVVTRAAAELTVWEDSEFGALPDAPDQRGIIYLVDGPNILTARSYDSGGPAPRLSDVTYYRRSPSGEIIEQIDAAAAIRGNDGWAMQTPRVFTIGTASVAEPPELTIAPGITPAQIELAAVDPTAQPFWQLDDSIAAYKAAGRDTGELEANYWHKISGPLSAVLMPILGAVAGFGLARSGQLFARAVIGMALGFAYFVIDNAALAMGDFGGYPPFLAAWAPFFLFLLIGETVLIRTEE
ncbi:MAG: LPS export ABC transporter permease LptG [Citromicrobium sp.]|nr:LPS export ABC transporter permease LptG [Citromicrobium sp.]